MPDESALRAALAGLNPVLLGFATKATGNADAASDLVQDTLVVALSSSASFERRSTLRTWVVGILAHKILDYYRQTSGPESESADLLATSTPEDLERVAIARQTLVRVREALGQLPPRERLAMLLVDVEGMTRPEACHALDVTATHLRVLLHRGRHRLRRMVEHD